MFKHANCTDIAAPWEALFVYDATVFALTFAKTWSVWRARKQIPRAVYAASIFEDGGSHFVNYQEQTLTRFRYHLLCVSNILTEGL